MQVREIVWDDARFMNFYFEWPDGHGEIPNSWPSPKDFDRTVYDIRARFDFDANQSARAKQRFMTGLPLDQDWSDAMTPEESMLLYRELYRQQMSMIMIQHDAVAFRKGLAGFPALHRITLTSEAHRPAIHRPYHKTPMIRSLPISFIYPCPLPWRPDLMPWREDDAYRNRGTHALRVILTELARAQWKYTIPEFVMETKFEDAGLAVNVFDGKGQLSEPFEMFIKNQGLRRFDLALEGQQDGAKSVSKGLQSFPFGRLRRMLSSAITMESFSLLVGAGSEHSADFVASAGGCRILAAIPINSWPSLRHLTLSCVPLVFAEFMKFLSKLPLNIDKFAFVDVFFAHHYADGHESLDIAEEGEQNNGDDLVLDRAIKEEYLNAIQEPRRGGSHGD
jgi:hypothetical protein